MNIFADFAILKNGQSNGGSPDSPTLAAVETMPVFFGGTTHTQSLEQTYWTGSSAKFQPTYGMEPLKPYAEVGTPSFFVPTTGAIGTFYSLVPWFGPAGAPFEPAYNPAKYGIQLMCAPANITLCWDHPETIFEPGIGTVPLPGHDHLVALFLDAEQRVERVEHLGGVADDEQDLRHEAFPRGATLGE